MSIACRFHQFAVPILAGLVRSIAEGRLALCDACCPGRWPSSRPQAGRFYWQSGNMCHYGHAGLRAEGGSRWGGHLRLARRRRLARVTVRLHRPPWAVMRSRGRGRLAQRARRLIRRPKPPRFTRRRGPCCLIRRRKPPRIGHRRKSCGMVPGSPPPCRPGRLGRRRSVSGAPARRLHAPGARAGCAGCSAQRSR